MTEILISLTAFGNAEVRRHGQLWFAQLALEAGADSVEVRGELLRDAERELPALVGRSAVYSCPEGLFSENGVLDVAAFEQGENAANALGASFLKMSIGGFGRGSQSSLSQLGERLARSKVELLVENDQSSRAGTLNSLKSFFSATESEGLELGMTFDMGNWHWVGECPLQAAAEFGHRVRYVHCKGVQRLPQKWVAVPLSQSSSPWRSVLRALPRDVPHAIEYPLTGDDLLAVTRQEIAQLRAARECM